MCHLSAIVVCPSPTPGAEPPMGPDNGRRGGSEARDVNMDSRPSRVIKYDNCTVVCVSGLNNERK